MQILELTLLILLDAFALMVLAALWSVRKEAIKRDLRRIAARLRWR